VFAAREAKPNDAMDPEVMVNAINKEVRGLFNRGAFYLVCINAVPLHAKIIGTRVITRLKHFGTIDKEAEARLILQVCQDAEKNRIVFNNPTVSHASSCILMFCRPDQFSRISYVADNSCLLESTLPSLFYTMTSHRDIYIYEC
jgi:hypothetical protein